MLISLTVNYVIDTDKKSFFENDTLLPEIKEALDSRFPQEIALSCSVHGKRNSLVHLPIAEDRDFVRCASCGKLLSLSGTVYLGLDYVSEIDGKKYCPSCAYEAKIDMLYERNLNHNKSNLE